MNNCLDYCCEKVVSVIAQLTNISVIAQLTNIVEDQGFDGVDIYRL